jgi:hypothetical protein
MIITIFGATGQTGRQLVTQALVKGYIVNAFGRNVYRTGFLKHDNLHLIQGALFDEKDVRNAIKGCDAVLSAIGGAFDGTDKSRSLGMKNIIEQMEKETVRRIIAVGGMGILPTEDGSLLMDAKDYPEEYLPVGREHLKAWELLKASSLDWTVIAAPDLVNADATGSYITAAEQTPPASKYKINTGDLAMCMLNELIKNEFVKQRVGISN